jgi:outer membrane lipoprotein SlyB
VAERDGGAQHAFAADQADLERHAHFGHGHQRDQAIVRKIDVADRIARLAQHGADVHLDLVERRQHARQVFRREARPAAGWRYARRPWVQQENSSDPRVGTPAMAELASRYHLLTTFGQRTGAGRGSMYGDARKHRPNGSGVGAAGGAILGGLLGNQVGSGHGRQIATVAGAVGGAVAGNQIEGNMKTTHTWDIVVRMDNGSKRTFHQSAQPNWRSGDSVRVAKGQLRSMD